MQMQQKNKIVNALRPLTGIERISECDVVPIKYGFLIAIPDYGCVIRLEDKGLLLQARHTCNYTTPFIIRPFGSYETKDYLVTVCPMVPKVGVGIKEHGSLTLELTSHRLGAGFSRLDDCGYIPVSSDCFPNGIPVIIDNGDVAPLTEKQLKEVNSPGFQYYEVSEGIDQFSLEQVRTAKTEQDRLYGKQSAAFANVLKEEFSSSSRHTFWETCRKFAPIVLGVSQGESLHRVWSSACNAVEEKKVHYSGDMLGRRLRTAGLSYAQRLAEDKFHKNILRLDQGASVGP